MLDPLRPASVAGIDASPIALELARKFAPSAELIEADVNDGLPFKSGSFDVVTIFNVLYHGWVRSEADVFAEAARVLRPGGLLLFTEPAFDVLKRGMDDVVMTRRRYRIDDFDPWLRSAGFEALFGSYFTAFGVPLLLGAKLLNRASRKTSVGELAADMRPLPGTVNALFLTLARIEAFALRSGMRMPFGTTLVRVARRLP
jgi:SAM-dependent methyltransferase